jgi:hypothetical protein
MEWMWTEPLCGSGILSAAREERATHVSSAPVLSLESVDLRC